MDSKLNGKIIKGVGGFYTVLTDGGKRYTCKARGLFRKLGLTPIPGDNVVISVDKKGAGFILEILPRVNELIRPAVANVDVLLIVVSAQEPLPDLELVDKLLLFCRDQSIRPILVINKCDCGENDTAASIAYQYSGAQIKVLSVSAETGFGMDGLFDLLTGCTVCLAGQSAVGKSSIINKLLGLELTTGELSYKTERGRHTTRHAELIQTPSGGLIADTPGFSMLESIRLEPEEIPGLYPEFEKYKGQCRFMGCMHLSEPDCAVKDAVKDGSVNKERYARYVKTANEAIEARRHRYD